MDKKIIRIDAGSQDEITQALRTRGRPLVTSYSASGWELKPYEYSYPGIKRCCHPMPGGCRSTATWRTMQRGEGAILHTGYYCETHIASKLPLSEQSNSK